MAKELVDQSKDSMCTIRGTQVSLSRKILNKLCYIVTNTNKGLQFTRFNFDNNIKFAKLISSMSSPSSISIFGCDINFEGD